MRTRLGPVLAPFGLLALALLAVGCDSPPTANAGSDRMVAVGQVVQLDGSASTDASKRPLAYRWEFSSLPSGSKALLSGAPSPATAVNPSFVPDVEGDYVVRLTVSSPGGTSQPATVKITASPCAPMLSAITTTPAMPTAGQTVQLAVTVSEACDDRPPYQYAWRLDALPAGSRAQLNSATTSDPSFFIDKSGTYAIGLRVTDQAGRVADAAPLTLQIATCGATPPVAQIGIAAPIPIAAPVVAPPMVAIALPTGDTVQLDGSTSSSPDNAAPCSAKKTLTYAWRFVSLPAGSNARLNDPQVVNPSFDIDVPGIYLLELVVTDSLGLSSPPVRVQVNGIDPRQIVAAAGRTAFNSLVLDPSAAGAPRIAYYDANAGRAMIARCTANCDTSPVWTVNTIDGGTQVGAFISLAVDGTGNLFAAYYDATLNRPKFAVSTDHGATWTISALDLNGSGGRFTSIALTAAGNPAVAWQGASLSTRYAVCSAGCTTASPTWSYTAVDTGTNTGYYASLAFDPVSGNPAVAYRNDQGAVLYSACSANCTSGAATFSTPIAADNPGGGINTNMFGGSGASLAISSTGAPSIAYRDENGQLLALASCTGGGCTTAGGWSRQVVDSRGGDTGEYPSLALSKAAASLDRPRISYRDVNNNSLRFASFNAASGWTVATLDNADPSFSSLKLTAADGVRLSYSVFGNRQLRYISFGP